MSGVATLPRVVSDEPGIFRSALHVLEFNLIGYRRRGRIVQVNWPRIHDTNCKTRLLVKNDSDS